ARRPRVMLSTGAPNSLLAWRIKPQAWRYETPSFAAAAAMLRSVSTVASNSSRRGNACEAPSLLSSHCGLIEIFSTLAGGGGLCRGLHNSAAQHVILLTRNQDVTFPETRQ